MPKVGDKVSFKIMGKEVEGEVLGFEGSQVRIKITKRQKGIPVAMKVALISKSSVNYDPILRAMPNKEYIRP